MTGILRCEGGSLCKGVQKGNLKRGGYERGLGQGRKTEEVRLGKVRVERR
jgi:hypothetical protein